MYLNGNPLKCIILAHVAYNENEKINVLIPMTHDKCKVVKASCVFHLVTCVNWITNHIRFKLEKRVALD